MNKEIYVLKEESKWLSDEITRKMKEVRDRWSEVQDKKAYINLHWDSKGR